MVPRGLPHAERLPRRARGASPDGRLDWKRVWPDIRDLLRPRRGVLLLGLVLILVSRLCGLVLPASTKFLIDDVLAKGRADLLAPLVAAVLAATAAQAVTGFALTQLLSKSAQRLISELRMRVQRHVCRLPVSFFDSQKTGQLVSRIMNDVEGVRNLVGTGLVEFLGGLLTAVFSFVILMRISPRLTLMAVCIVLVFGLILRKGFRTLRPIFRERSQISSEVTGRLAETLGGIRVVKAYHAEQREDEVFAAGVRRILDNVFRSLTGVSLLSLSATVLLGIVGATVMYVGGREILAGSLTLGGFVTFSAFMAFMIAPVFQVVGVGTQLTEAIAGLERTRELLDMPAENQSQERTVQLGVVRGEVAFEDVWFQYEEGKEVLRGVSFKAEPGTVTALVGSSGSGKSTILGLIASFYTPTRGRVTVDGTDLSRVALESYRRQLGVVLQETFLFDGTIRENVAFARPDASAEEVLAACRLARVDEFAERLPDGYDTVVGERGVKLSGGQKQRVSIARAILVNPRILLLDEATSSLDSETEALIQEGLGHLMEGRTTFVIAHRLSTIRRAHRILVVEEGLIVEDGTHDQLIASRGRYHELYTRQHGLERNLFLAPGEADAVAEETHEG
jgi:subfamily B ATP-binding cassette protein MsbA